jgi:hypothetical protein
MENGIIIWLIGGLGNQMFIVCAGIIISQYYNCNLYILNNPDNNNPHNTKKNNYKKNIFKYFGTHIDKEQYENNIPIGYKSCSGNVNPFGKYNITDFKPPCILSNYFQYYPIIKNFESQIRTLFLNGIEDNRKEISEKYNLSNSAFLHIRRGDYLAKQHVHPVIDISYYKYCIKNIYNDVDNIYIFSNDINWVNLQEIFKDNKFIIIDNDNEIYCLAFMSLCMKGAICANSTFSWWGAFLGAYKLRNKVFVPKNWIIGYDFKNIFPEEWIIV